MIVVEAKRRQKKSTISEKLQSNDVFYKHIVESTPEAVVIHSEGKILYVNQAAVTLIGAKNTKDLIDQSVMRFIHKDSLPLIQSRIKNLLNKNKIAPFVEEKFVRLNGDIIFAETKAVPVTINGKMAIVAILRDITQRKKIEEKQNFLVQVSSILGESVEYKATLHTICKLLVPYLADYIRIALFTDDKNIEEVAAYHIDHKKLSLVKKLYETYKDRVDITHGVPQVVRSGKAEIIKRVTPQYLKKSKSSPEIKKIVNKLGLVSYMGVPLKIKNQVIGVITISSTRKERIYTKEDLQFAEEIAGRVAFAVENALLFNNLQKELQEKIKAQEGEERLASYLDQTFDAILLWEYSGKLVYWNKGAEELYGYTKEEAVGEQIHPFLKTVHPIPFSQIESILNEKGRWEGELIHTTKEGKPITVSCKKVLFTEKDGKQYVLETNRDMTERSQYQKHLQFLSESGKILSSSLGYKTTLKNIAMLAVPHIADWCTVDIKTEKGIEQLAVAHVDPNKVKWAKELNKKDPPDPNAQTGVPNVIRTGKSEYYPKITDEMLTQAAKNKKQLALLRELMFSSIMIIPIRVNDETIGAITFVYAKSKRFYTKSDLTIAEELAVRAGLAIENAQLYRDARRAVNLRDEFISLASHELKTPITSLKMYAQSLSKQFEKRNDIFMQGYFIKMDQQIDRLALLVSDLLNVSKIQHGNLEFDWKSVDLNSVIKETVDMLQIVTRQHKIILRGKIEKTVRADPYRIYQVLTNLLTNATKYSPQADKVMINLSEKKGYAEITVQDFGIGIEPDEQKKIFGQYYRVNQSEKKFTGLGMGLFISHEIIERHGGEMKVKSVKGKGSQFSFTLPFILSIPKADK